MSDSPKVLRGVKLGDRRVRVERPHARFFRYEAPGVYSAKLAAEEPTDAAGRALARGRRLLFGRPLSSEEEVVERLPVWKALPVFSSDLLSSVAYATEASLFTLLAAGAATFAHILPISFGIVGVLLVVTFSYRQTVRAYPDGGGSYIVAHSNLGVLPGLAAAAALLAGYVLTAAVSTAAGIVALGSAIPEFRPFMLPLMVASILIVMAVNLRGVRESGAIFAVPTYLFVLSALAMVAVGVVRTALGSPPQVTGVEPAATVPAAFSALILARAFADGCSAMTGTEAVANGVPAFREPAWKSAQATMAVVAGLLAVILVGIGFLALVSGATPAASGESVLSQVARATFGVGPSYYVLQFATMGILLLAANTSFNGLPRLTSILARDGYFPRQFAFQGERLAFNVGIVALALLSIGVLVLFRGSINALIPLYAIGVFTAFTLSQAGMVHHWLVERGPGWRRSALINGIGATVTALVTAVFAVANFALGAWTVIVLVAALVALMLFVHRAYIEEARRLSVRAEVVIPPPHRVQHVIVAAPSFTRAVVQAIRVGQTMSRDVHVVHVTSDLAEGEHFMLRAEQQVPGVSVTVVESRYRTLVNPFVRYLEVDRELHPDDVTVVLLPEYVPQHWWDRLLYNQNTHRIRRALVGRRDIVVLDVPYRA